MSPWEGVIRLWNKGKLGPRFIGPFKISSRIGKVAYRLDFPDELSHIHNTFHVSQLRKRVADEATIILLDDIQVDEIFNYVEKPIAILAGKLKLFVTKW